VLPGIYQERLTINKNVRILSDFVRTGNLAAIASTIVDGQHIGRLLTYEGFTPTPGMSLIEGFTFKRGFADGNTQGAGIYLNTSSSTGFIEIKNSKFSDIYRVCCQGGIALSMGWNSPQRVRFTNVDFTQIGGTQNGDQRNAFSISNNSKVEFINSNINDVYCDDGIFAISGGDVLMYNTKVFNSNTRTNSDGVFRILGNNSKLTLLHSSVYNVHFDNQGSDRFVVYNAGGMNSTITIRNSVLSQANNRIFKDGAVSSTYTIEGSVVSSLNTLSYSLPTSSLVSAAQLSPTGTLLSSSPAIGRGVTSWHSSYPTISFGLDAIGGSRPQPTGSNPDAGAIESSLAIGLFEASISNCGYELTAQVLNSSIIC
jgi:hypothetical protein